MDLEIDIWDVGAADYDRVAARLLDHFEDFEVWSGARCAGLFTVEERSVVYGSEAPRITVRGFDGMRRLKRETKSRVFASQRTMLQALQTVATEHGFELDADPAQFRKLPTPVDVTKKLGETDAELVTRICMAEGFGLPYVRYEPATISGEYGTEYLVCRRLFIPDRVSDFDLAVTRPGEDGDLASFEPHFDTGDLPVAVEVVGWDRVLSRPFRVTVVATPSGPRIESIDYEDITRDERLRIGSGRGGRDSPAVLVRLLGSGTEQVDTGVVYRANTKGRPTIRAKREYREILAAHEAKGISDVKEYALQYMASRMSGFITCSGSLLQNMERAGELDVGQVHEVTGALPEHNGLYLLTKVHHAWGDAGHGVQFDGQRVIDLARTTALPRVA